MLPLRVLGAAMAAVLLTGCSVAAVWNEVPARAPSYTPAPATPEPDERTQRPYTGALAKDAACVGVSSKMLAQLQEIGNVGGAVTYAKGARVKANARWWAVAVATEVHPNSQGLSADNVPAVAYFVTNEPSIPASAWEDEVFYWKLGVADDAATAKAAWCLKRVPDPPKKVDPNSPESYTGKLAASARCVTASKKLLARLEQVGQVGGAITYSRGQVVRANGKWWTVAVATEVHANSEGLTRDNVPATALFVTNAPSYPRSSTATIVSFPIKERKGDAAAAKSLACLRG